MLTDNDKESAGTDPSFFPIRGHPDRSASSAFYSCHLVIRKCQRTSKSGRTNSAPETRMRLSGQLSAAVIGRGPSSVIRNVSQLTAPPQLLFHVTAQPF